MIRAALAGSPGLTEVAAFGPAQRPAFRSGDRRPGRRRADPPAVEVFAVAGAERVTAYPDDGAVALSGGPEGVLLAGRRRPARRPRGDGHGRRRRPPTPPRRPPTRQADARWPRPAPARTRTRSCRPTPCGGGRTTPAPTRAGATRPRCRRRPVPRPDLGPYDAAEQAVAVLEGAAAVTASSSADDPFAADPAGGALPRPGPPAGRRGRRRPGHRLGVGRPARSGSTWSWSCCSPSEPAPGDRRPGHRSRRRPRGDQHGRDHRRRHGVRAGARRGEATVAAAGRRRPPDPGDDHRRGRRPAQRRGRRSAS